MFQIDLNRVNKILIKRVLILIRADKIMNKDENVIIICYLIKQNIKVVVDNSDFSKIFIIDAHLLHAWIKNVKETIKCTSRNECEKRKYKTREIIVFNCWDLNKRAI